MKKSLLLGCALLTAGTSFAAVPNDGLTYEPIDGVTLENLWTASKDINPDAMNDVMKRLGRAVVDDAGNITSQTANKSRMCTAANGKIYISSGAAVTEGEGDAAVSHEYWDLVSFDLYTGEYLNTVQMTLNGAPLDGLLAAQNIGTDDYGHIWVAPYSSGAEGTTLKVYMVNPETGELTLVGNEIEWPADEAGQRCRIDYCDVTGDITLENDGAYYGAVGSGGEAYAYRFVLPQGSTEWELGMEGYAAWAATDVVNAAGEAVTGWGDTGTFAWMEGCNDMFYADGRSVVAAAYSCAGGVAEFIGDMTQADQACTPAKAGDDTGAWEWNLNEKMWLGYGNGQGGDGASAKISMMGGAAGAGTYEGMTLAWTLPASGSYTAASNGGGINQLFCAGYETDENGKKAAYLVRYYHQAVLAVFRMAEPGFSAGVNDIIADQDVNAPVEYFNLQGVRVANPENGIFVKRQGSTVTKVVK